MQSHDKQITDHEDEDTSDTSLSDLGMVVDVANESTDPARY